LILIFISILIVNLDLPVLMIRKGPNEAGGIEKVVPRNSEKTVIGPAVPAILGLTQSLERGSPCAAFLHVSRTATGPCRIHFWEKLLIRDEGAQHEALLNSQQTAKGGSLYGNAHSRN